VATLWYFAGNVAGYIPRKQNDRSFGAPANDNDNDGDR